MTGAVKETAKSRAARLAQEVGDASKATYTKGEVKAILNKVSSATSDEGCRSPAHVSDLRRGDVFIAKTAGGKVRPWIALRVSDGIVTALAMSSSASAPNMIRADCRYWDGSWIGSTVSQFYEEHASQEVTRPYTNLRHLREVERGIYSMMGAKRLGPKSIADVRAFSTQPMPEPPKESDCVLMSDERASPAQE